MTEANSSSSNANPFARVLGVFSGLSAAFAAVIAFLNHVTDLPVASQKNHWLIYFLPDALILTAMITLASTLYFLSGRDLFSSIWHLLRSSNMPRTILLVALILLSMLLIFPVADAIIDHYAARKFPALFDWHYAFARQAFQRRRCEQALTELRRQGPRLNYLNPVFKDRIKKEEVELLRRMRDADSMVDRYQSSLEGGFTFYNALKVERAAMVCSDCKSVRAVAADLKKNLTIAVDEYLQGVERLRATDTNAAIVHLKLSQKSCSQLFHQKELLKYLADPSSATKDSETSQLIAFYTKTPMPQLRSWILEYPPLERLLNIGVE